MPAEGAVAALRHGRGHGRRPATLARRRIDQRPPGPRPGNGPGDGPGVGPRWRPSASLILLISTVSFVLVAWLWARAEERAGVGDRRPRSCRPGWPGTNAKPTARPVGSGRTQSTASTVPVREAIALRLARKTGYRVQVRDLIKQALGSDARTAMWRNSGARPWPAWAISRGRSPDSGLTSPRASSSRQSRRTRIRRASPGPERRQRSRCVPCRAAPSAARLRGPDSGVSDVAFAPGGRTLIAADLNGAVTIWEFPRKADAWSRSRTIAADRPLPGYRVG